MSFFTKLTRKHRLTTSARHPQAPTDSASKHLAHMTRNDAYAAVAYGTKSDITTAQALREGKKLDTKIRLALRNGK